MFRKGKWYSMDGETEVDPEKDLSCLCANCHRMIHRKRNYVMDVSELREIVESNKKKG